MGDRAAKPDTSCAIAGSSTGLAPEDWIDRLRELGLRALGGSARTARPGFDDAPPKVRDVAAALLLLQRRGSQHDAALAVAHRRDTALQRELHHRVRNNLQIITSHLAMGEAEVTDPSARRMLRETRLRVAALSLTHRLLWDGSDTDGLPVGTLIEAIANLTGLHLGTAVAVDIGGKLRDVRVNLDFAVPLSLWTVEALCALGPAPDESGDVAGMHLSLACGARWALVIRTPLPAPAPLSVNCVKLLGGHAAQLPAGTLRLDDSASPSTVTLEFNSLQSS